jgi:hypothetical protein
LELDEIETKEGFVCLLPSEDLEYLNINIHLSKTHSTNIHKKVEENKNKLVNLNIGDSKVLSDIDLYDEYYLENQYEKNVLIKLNNGDIYFSIENPVIDCFYLEVPSTIRSELLLQQIW